MSSENEMVNRSAENRSDEIEESQTVLPASTEITAVSHESAAEEPDWEAWLLANPEEEEAASVTMPEAERAAPETSAAPEVTAVAETSSSPEEPSAENAAEAPEPPDEATSEPPQAPRKKHPQGLQVKDVIRYFAPCGRCGYFLTAYRAAYGEAHFKTAVIEERAGWLTLNWNDVVCHLILKSYGREVEAPDLHFSSSCPECRRVLVYDATSPTTFRLELKPGSGER